ncbi:MAG TPA: DUF4845 domain-containing protein [Xanthomonadaceae bacterium]|nr:DUF4845 domain-containing protein [Xanthomonadaceae bacterium]
MTKTIQHQRGITLLGFVFILVVLGFFAYMVMRLFPMYTEFYSVSSAMEAIKKEPGVAQSTPHQVREMLFARLYISYVENVKPQHVTISRDRGAYTMTVKYEIEAPFIHNIHFLGRFDKTGELTGRPGD